MRRLPGEHAPNCKNRSSKNLSCLTKIKPIYRCLSGDALREMAANKCLAAERELARRSKLNKRGE